MAMDKNSTASQDNTTSVIGKTLKVLAYPIAAGIGFVVAKTKIEDHTYDELKKRGAFKDIQDEHAQTLSDIVENAAEQAIRDNKPTNILKATAAEHASYTNLVKERLKGFKLDSLVNKYNYINKSDRQRAVLDGFTSSGIAIGAILAIGNSKTLTHLFSKHSPESNKQNSIS